MTQTKEVEFDDGTVVEVSYGNGDVSTEVSQPSPRDVDGDTIEFDGTEIEVEVRANNIGLRVDGALLNRIPRDGWKLDSYITYTLIPGYLAQELKDLGFEYDESGDPLRE